MQTASTARRPVRPTTAADLWRLAEQGRANGVRILAECVSGERFASSASQPGTVYRLTAYSCSCPGFCQHQRCQHHSLLLAELGWLPEVAGDEDPEPPTPAAPAVVVNGRVTCPGCGRIGVILQDKPLAPGWRCPRCRPAVAPAPTAPADLDLAALLSDDDEDEDGGRWNDDIAEECPDDSSRFAAVAARYHAGRAA